ncbi:leucyl/phenylalanyl-tRNA--protein transferase [Cypionkella aquatica]|uniref:Leucyl/phenylalanyl-tRNA--protein transferase n=1 Tax=Cypionkella aquatica TaxID=1756042 RepID=A0AA37X0R5_9RHOB|nr:leucyl/phenylalanyl-tRNA--protein transferase [Cypionkella aquatica]GLS87169.1 leucyl/phenylalanyl-tRNA--protein transferase [Cypionkella aquatica]
MNQSLTPEILLRAYGLGIFPMAESRDNPEIHWVDPKRRGVFPLDGFHISRSLAKHILTASYRVSVNEAFSEVVAGCADRAETWINAEITALYTALHQMGHAHSLEVWEGEALIGGVYGVTLGAAFFGESMFSRQTNASKTALAYLLHRLRAGGFQLFDTQFLTDHLASLGAVEIPRAEYQRRLALAHQGDASFSPVGYQPLPSSVVSSSAG